MIIIGFAEKTSKLLPRIFCKHFRHCAPIVCTQKSLVMYQFVKRNHIARIPLKPRDIGILKAHGWQFVYISPTASRQTPDIKSAYSCVDLSKRVIGIKSIFIQTPNALYKHLLYK